MVGNSLENLIQPHLWPEERLVWCERPTSLGAVVAQVSYAYKGGNAAVELFSAPLSLFVGLAWLVGVTPIVIFVLWFPLGLGLAVVIVALVAAIAAGVYGWYRARGTCYAITDRRVLAVRGADSDWTLHEAWDQARGRLAARRHRHRRVQSERRRGSRRPVRWRGKSRRDRRCGSRCGS